MVGKKGGDMRLFHDYRELNKITTKIRYPLPLIEDILHLLNGAKYFTTLDLFSGFWQIEIAECDRYKTAFSCEFGHSITFACHSGYAMLQVLSKTPWK
jgi:hypothetical protein